MVGTSLTTRLGRGWEKVKRSAIAKWDQYEQAKHPNWGGRVPKATGWGYPAGTGGHVEGFPSNRNNVETSWGPGGNTLCTGGQVRQTSPRGKPHRVAGHRGGTCHGGKKDPTVRGGGTVGKLKTQISRNWNETNHQKHKMVVPGVKKQT